MRLCPVFADPVTYVTGFAKKGHNRTGLNLHYPY